MLNLYANVLRKDLILLICVRLVKLLDRDSVGIYSFLK